MPLPMILGSILNSFSQDFDHAGIEELTPTDGLVQPEPEFRPGMSEVTQALVRLMQRANLNKRRSGDDLGGSARSFQGAHDVSESSA